MPYKDPQKRKEYHANYLKKWNKDNIEKRREYGRKSMQKWRDENRELAAIKMREWRTKNKKRHLEFVSNYKKNNPEKATAHRLVLMAVKIGTLVREPCSVCGNLKSQAHHEDYSKPLEVKWLCQKHHSEIHSNKRLGD